MALVVADRVRETTTTTGTGTITLAGASAGFQSFAVIGNGNTTYYAIVDIGSGAWEVGTGTYTASGTTLARTTILASSNGGSVVNLGAGTKDVFVTYPATKSVYENAPGDVAIKGNIYYNARTISVDRTIGATENAMSVGPITIADTKTVTIADGGEWVIV